MSISRSPDSAGWPRHRPNISACLIRYSLPVDHWSCSLHIIFCVLFVLCFAGYRVSLVIGIPVPGCSRLVYQNPHAPKKKTRRGEKGFDSPCLCDDARRCDAKWLMFSVGGPRWPPLTLLLCADTSAGEEIIRTDSHEAFDECRSNSSHRTSVCNGAGTQAHAHAQPSPGFDVRPACVHKCATTHVLMCVHKYL